MTRSPPPRRASLRRALPIVALVAAAGCSGAATRSPDSGVIPGEPDGAVTDAPPDAPPDAGFYPGCHVDCFGRASCHDGVVRVFIHAPVPCEYWSGSCPVVATHACTRGCFAEGDSFGQDLSYYDILRDPELLCFEGTPKAIGSPCAAAADCLPEPEKENGDGAIETVYLRCNLAAGACEAAPAPVVPDFMARCGPDIQEQRGTGLSGAAADGHCSGGVCLYQDDLTAACLRQGCSATCATTHDCPQGSICDAPLHACWSRAGADGLAVLSCPAP